MGKTQIQWTDYTWNIARGCSKVDSDCKFCYMYRDGERFKYDAKSVIRTKSVFKLPLRIKEPSKIFTSSLTDVFHPDIDSFRGEMWDIIKQCPQHTFQILTKRPNRISRNLPNFWKEINQSIWLGTSIGHQNGMSRLRELIYPQNAMWLPEKFFLSIEPLHGEINFDSVELSMIDWVIVGGESGNETGKYRYRECKLEWIESIIEQCRNQGVSVFVKQLGTHLSKQMSLKDRHGGDIDEWPQHLKIREFPND